jgi:hypothetical protein
MRRLVLLIGALVTAAVVLRRRRPREHVDVEYEDGSLLRLDCGPEARGLRDYADAILDVA